MDASCSKTFAQAIRAAHAAGRKIGICGQAPSDYPEFARFLVEQGIYLLAALREGDYSIRARGANIDEPLGQVMFEANVLGETLHDQRLGALEATNLLRTVMAEIEVAVFAFNEVEELKLVNRAGERLLAQPAERLLGRRATELDLSECLTGAGERTFQKTFPGMTGRWGMRRGSFREEGRPHTIVVLSDLSHALREEERQAWRRLIRVIGHELNNSLAPIKSMAGTLAHLLDRGTELEAWRDDMKRGLGSSAIAARPWAAS